MLFGRFSVSGMGPRYNRGIKNGTQWDACSRLCWVLCGLLGAFRLWLGCFLLFRLVFYVAILSRHLPLGSKAEHFKGGDELALQGFVGLHGAGEGHVDDVVVLDAHHHVALPVQESVDGSDTQS